MADITSLVGTGTLSAARATINSNFTAVQTLFRGTAEPSSPVAGQPWLDALTAGRPLKIRNEANSGWVTLIPDTTVTSGGFLALTGGTMSGAIAMGSTKVTGLANGTASGDAVNKGQVDAQVHSAGTTIAGFSATVNRLFFIAPASCTIIRVYLLSDVATTGSGAGTRYDFQVRNLGTSGSGTTDLLSVVKTTNGAEITAGASYNLGADQNLTMAVGESLQLRVTVTGSPTSLASANILAIVHYGVAV